MLKHYFFVLMLILPFTIHAQLLPLNQPEQDACNALLLCGTPFSTPFSYDEEGTILDLPMTPCGGSEAPESNSVWLKLMVNTSGIFVFKITPAEITDDYDFAVINATGKDCSSLGSADVVRCNFNNNSPVFNSGIVGLSSTATATGVAFGTTGSSYCKYINAVAGETYLIMVNNFGIMGSPSSGFTIDFTGSTATFYTSDPPAFSAIEPPTCNYANEVTLQLSSEVKCSSVATNGSDFYLTPAAAISSATGINCTDASGTGYTDEVTVSFSDPLPPGTYTLHAQSGTDGNTLLDLCNNPLAIPDEITFTVPKLKDTVYMTRCINQLPFVWNGITVTGPGAAAAVKSSVSAVGCDSTTVLNLTVVDAFHTVIDTTLCTNQVPFIWNGISITGSGTPAATFSTTSISGCDSVVTLNLEVTPIKETLETIEVCSNELPFFWNGFTFPEGTATTDSIAVFNTTTATGCDSIVTLNLVVHPTNPSSSAIDTSGCGFVTFKDKTYHNGTTIIDTLVNRFGCDSVYNTVHIIVYNNEPSYTNVAADGCEKVVFENNTYLSDTTLIDTFRNIHGCDSLVRTVNVYVENFELSLNAEPEEAVQGEYLTLTAEANVPSFNVTSWSPAFLFSDQDAIQQIFRVYKTELYTITAESAIGCKDTAEVSVFVDTLRPEVLMPNAFSPNGDGLNDLFGPRLYNKSGFVVLNFNIYNRWGNLVYKSDANTSPGWDGTYYNQGKPADPGVYYYRIEVLFVNGQKVVQKGDVTLVK